MALVPLSSHLQAHEQSKERKKERKIDSLSVCGGVMDTQWGDGHRMRAERGSGGDRHHQRCHRDRPPLCLHGNLLPQVPKREREEREKGSNLKARWWRRRRTKKGHDLTTLHTPNQIPKAWRPASREDGVLLLGPSEGQAVVVIIMAGRPSVHPARH